MSDSNEWIRVRGARVHNLRNVDVDLPRDRLTVLTGPSGSGKSSLAFDTLHAEGQRRYLETLRVDPRALFDQLQRPDVDLIDGLPPTLCVSQHTASVRPRSTLATLTEIHDHLRLLWARLGTPHCWQCGQPIHKHTIGEIVRQTLGLEEGRKVLILAPLVNQEKGEHREIFQTMRQAGYQRMRVNGVVLDLRDTPRLDPGRPHSIEVVVDRLVVRPALEDRLRESLQTALKLADGAVVVSELTDEGPIDQTYSTRFACPRCRISYSELQPRSFSFNNPQGACPACDGLGLVRRLDPDRLLPNLRWTIKEELEYLRNLAGEAIMLPAFDRRMLQQWRAAFPAEEKWGATTPLERWPKEAREALLHGTTRTAPPFPGLLALLQSPEKEDEADSAADSITDLLGGHFPCPECGGARLNREARSVRFAGKALPEVTALTVAEALAFFADLPVRNGDGRPSARVRQVLLGEITQRLRFLVQVGLGYLTLDRPAPTLSGGELQRARLATHLGAGLLGVCYILDEPTIGLHPRDTDRLLAALRDLQQSGNTVILVEHDESVIRQADWIVDIGPGAGRAGGRVLHSGPAVAVLDQVLPPGRTLPVATLPAPQQFLTIRGARHHNLKNIDVAIPLGRLTCVTGVSGSGKSSLVYEILCRAVRRHLGLASPEPGAHDRIDGLEQIDQIIEVDQTPLGRSSRSNAASYTGIYEEVRQLFAATREAKARGYKANRFSFNTRGGRCEECQGQGVRKVALHFMPELTIPCPVCRGRRFNPATLEIRYKGKSIADVLDLSAEAALDLFQNVPALVRPLQALVDVGLGYLTLGQPSSTLSGGEAQRVKLAAELARTTTGRTLLLLDEPTTGLHFTDVARLVQVLRRLVEAGNTLVIIEHHLDVIAVADWVIDLGPEAGEAGGQVLAAGPPPLIAACPESVTGKWLQKRMLSPPLRPAKLG